nr:MAG TPA: Respiratory growth induced protein 1 [Caudoviricetes sp.]DAV01747.1 MAG TPA: Respiratory growth induced protein 1 [Caudoviricetes sp.]
MKKSQKYSIIYIEVKGKEKQRYIPFREEMFDELLTFEKFFRIINT